MASVSIRNVWKFYGKTAAVKDLDIEIAEGEFVCILGPSGCGKSSTLRMLAGLEHISAGEILFGDQRVNEVPPKERDIAMVFENYALYPHKSVYENIANSLRLRNTPKDSIEQKVRKAAEMLEIDGLLDRKPLELSGGQKQRVAIGRAIVREPRLFLFDEPIAHLDAKLRAYMRVELKILQRELGTTMVYVTHDQLEALSMADRIAVMHEGVLQQLGTPQNIYNNPVNEWVAGFVGEPPMNFIDCEIADHGGKLFVEHANFSVPLSDKQTDILRQNGATGGVRMAIRPDEVAVRSTAESSYMPGKVSITEPLGGDILVDVTFGDQKILVKTKPDFAGSIGEQCYLKFDTERWHLFAQDTGQAYF